MNAIIAAPLGVAAALVSAAADATVQTKHAPEPEPLIPPAIELARELPAPEARSTASPPAGLLEPQPLAETARIEAADPGKLCDEKCKFVELTKVVLPNTPVPDLVSVALEPDKHALNIPAEDGTTALTIKLDPTKIARGKGLVATAKF